MRALEDLASRLDGEVEAVQAFATPLPAFVIGELLGLDHGLHASFKRWSDDILSVTPEPPGDAHAARVRGTIAELDGYLRDVVSERRRAPADDTVSDLVRAEVDGQSLTDREVVDFLVVLLLGGFETTTLFLGNALVFLAERPDDLARLGRDQSLVPRFVEEMLRYDGPSQSLPRFTTEDVTLSGVTIPRGAMVLALVGSANHDERSTPTLSASTSIAPPRAGSSSATASTSASAPRSPGWRRGPRSRRWPRAFEASSGRPARSSTTARSPCAGRPRCRCGSPRREPAARAGRAVRDGARRGRARGAGHHERRAREVVKHVGFTNRTASSCETRCDPVALSSTSPCSRCQRAHASCGASFACVVALLVPMVPLSAASIPPGSRSAADRLRPG